LRGISYLSYVINDKDMENLIGKMVHVVVSKGGKSATKFLKVCKVKARSVLFIEVDKENRKNIFRKVKTKDITPMGLIEDSPAFFIKDGVLPDKWESAWDAIGTSPTPSYARPYYSNHSKGWSATIRPARGSSMDALAVSVSTRSTTNSAAGFPMV
jgi:hypothetical protein